MRMVNAISPDCEVQSLDKDASCQPFISYTIHPTSPSCQNQFQPSDEEPEAFVET